MGNSISKRLEEKYNQNDFSVIDSKQDQLLGMFAIWKFQLSSQIICMHKIFDPNQYDESSGIDKLLSNMFSEEKNICDFYLIKNNRQNQELYDLVFEYGHQIALPFAKEKYIWILLEQITEAMIQIENKKLHYPYLHIAYIVQLEKKIFKLINPYCFSNFAKDVLRIYINPMVKVSERIQFQRKKIAQNIYQLGCLVVNLLGDFDSTQIYQDIVYRNNCIQLIQQNISKELLSFLKYIFYDLSKMTPQSFRQIKKFIENNKPKRSHKLVRKIFNNKQKKFGYYKPTQDAKQMTKQYLIFDSNKNLPRKQTVKDQLNVMPQPTPVQQKISLPIQNLSSFYMDEFNNQNQNSTSKNIVKRNLFQNNFMNDPKFNKPLAQDNQQKNYQNLINKNQQQCKQENQQDLLNQQQQQQEQIQKQNDDSSDDEFFKKNTFSQTQINSQKIEKDDDFFNVSQNGQVVKEEQIDYFNENAPFQQQNFFESIQDEKQLDQVNDNQQKQDVKQQLFSNGNHGNNKEDNLDNINSTQEIQSQEENTNYYDDSSSQNSDNKIIDNKIKKKYIFRYISDEKTYKKYVIYEDDTEEQIQMTQEEMKHFGIQNQMVNQQLKQQNIQQNLSEPAHQYFSEDKYSNQQDKSQKNIKDNQNQEQSEQNLFYSQYQQNKFIPDFTPPPNLLEDLDQTESIDITLMDKENNIHFILYPGERMNPLVLYRKKTQKNFNFDEIQKIVDFKNKMKPSMYHQVEVEDKDFKLDPQIDTQQCIQKLNPSLKGTLKSRQTLIKSKFQLMYYNQFKLIVFQIK